MCCLCFHSLVVTDLICLPVKILLTTCRFLGSFLSFGRLGLLILYHHSSANWFFAGNFNYNYSVKVEAASEGSGKSDSELSHIPLWWNRIVWLKYI